MPSELSEIRSSGHGNVFDGAGSRLRRSQIECHLLRHRCAVFVAQMSIRHCNQHAAVLVTEPASDHFEVTSGLDGIRAEEVAHRMVAERRKS